MQVCAAVVTSAAVAAVTMNMAAHAVTTEQLLFLEVCTSYSCCYCAQLIAESLQHYTVKNHQHHSPSSQWLPCLTSHTALCFAYIPVTAQLYG